MFHYSRAGDSYWVCLLPDFVRMVLGDADLLHSLQPLGLAIVEIPLIRQRNHTLVP